MLYALIGIPILLTALNELGKSLFKLLLLTVRRSKKIYRRFHDNKSPGGAPVEKVVVRPAREFGSHLRQGSCFQFFCFQSKNVLWNIFTFEEKLFRSFRSQARWNQQGQKMPKLCPSLLHWLSLSAGFSSVPPYFASGNANGHTLNRFISSSSGIFPLFLLVVYKLWQILSLTTIGLGDVIPEHPKYMTIAYGLVVIGLALVSMSISVIQNKIEQLYYQFLQKLLEQYQTNMITGQNEMDANVDMMKMWTANPRAKYLMPLLLRWTFKNILLQNKSAFQIIVFQQKRKTNSCSKIYWRKQGQGHNSAYFVEANKPGQRFSAHHFHCSRSKRRQRRAKSCRNSYRQFLGCCQNVWGQKVLKYFVQLRRKL